VALASEHGFALWAGYGRVLHGWAVAQKGEATTGIACIRDGLAAYEATGNRASTPFYLTLLAEALALAGKIEEGLAALAIAREQGTRGYELRAATSLTRLWREQGRRGEARDLLAPLYGSFTEGFDTADLKEAKALLAELA
jgi:predicted ATPase